MRSDGVNAAETIGTIVLLWNVKNPFEIHSEADGMPSEGKRERLDNCFAIDF